MSINKKLGMVGLTSFKKIIVTHWTNKNIRSRIKKSLFTKISSFIYMATQIFKIVFVIYSLKEEIRIRFIMQEAKKKKKL